MTLSLVSSVPSSGTVDFFINKSISLTFNQALDTTTLVDSVISIVAIDSGARVPIAIERSALDTSTVVITTSAYLEQNTDYRIVILGLDMGLGFCLKGSSGDQLSDTIQILFSTGSTVYKIDTTVQKEASNLTLEGQLFLPTNVKALGYEFTVEKVRPKNHTHDNAPSLTGDSTIRFTFSKALYTGTADYTEWLDVDTFPLLNDSRYLASGETFDLGSDTITIPDYTVSVTGQDLLVSFQGTIPNNVGIQIKLLDGITSSEDDEYSGEMLYSINTAMFPTIYGVQAVSREIQDFAKDFNKDYISALLFKNMIMIWERIGRNFTLSDPPYAARQYVLYSTVLDLMEDKEYAKYVYAGSRRQIGDLNVSIDNLIGRMAMKVAKYQKAKDIAFESLMPGWQLKVGQSILAYDAMAATINRLWYDINGRYTDNRFSYFQDDIPASNVDVNRHARMNNPVW